MSNQSGITATEELLNCLNCAPNEGIIVITAEISADTTEVQLKDQFTSTQELKNSLGPDPCYIFVKDNSVRPTEKYVFISYIPESSSVRSRMLYASTKNTLVRQVGSNSVGRQPLCTSPDDVVEILETADHGENHDSSLLTESEKVENDIAEEQKRIKAATTYLQRHQLVSQTGGSPTTLSFNVLSDGSSIKGLLDEQNLVSFQIKLPEEQIEISKKSVCNSADKVQLINDSPSYTLFRNGELYYFIYSCPSGSKVKERMIYASNKSGFIKYLQENEGINFTKVLEIGDPDELEISWISNSTESEMRRQEEMAAHGVSSQKFSRPRGPQRRRRD